MRSTIASIVNRAARCREARPSRARRRGSDSEVTQGGGECLGTIRRHDQPVAAVLDQELDPGGGGGHDRQPRRQGLEQDVGQPLLAARDREEVERGEHGRPVALAQPEDAVR